MLGRLALELKAPLARLMDEMPAWEVSYWHAFENQFGPIGFHRTDLYTAAGVYTSMGFPKDGKASHAFGLIYHLHKELERELEREQQRRIDVEKVKAHEPDEVLALASKIAALTGRPGPSIREEVERGNR